VLQVRDTEIELEATFMVRYADERLFSVGSSPCTAVLPHVLSISEGVAADQSRLLQKLDAADALIRLPTPDVRDRKGPMLFKQRSFRLKDRHPESIAGQRAVSPAWRRLLPPNIDELDDIIGPHLSVDDQHSSFASLAYKVRVTARQDFTFLAYPFDKQTVEIAFINANVTTCATPVILSQQDAHGLLAGNDPYELWQPLRTSRDAHGVCTLKIHIRRKVTSCTHAEAPTLGSQLSSRKQVAVLSSCPVVEPPRLQASRC
jgi:hypothetical protein